MTPTAVTDGCLLSEHSHPALEVDPGSHLALFLGLCFSRGLTPASGRLAVL